MDTWTREQLDLMVEGGNAKAREAMGETVLNLKDLKSKYTSHASIIYKEKLQKRALNHKETSVDNNLIQFDTAQPLIDFDDAPYVETALVETTLDDDFDIFKPIPTSQHKPQATSPSIFDELSGELSQAKTTTSVYDELSGGSSHTTTPSIFDELLAEPGHNTGNTAVEDFFDQFEKPITPKRTFKPKTAHRSKLGARKVQSNVFQQQNELAMQEERMREQGIDQESIDRSSRNKLMMSDTKPIPKLQPPSTRLNYEPFVSSQQTKESAEERLGMMSLSSSVKPKEVEVSNNEDTFARDKFGNAKAISSDQYFGRNDVVYGRPDTGYKKKTPMSKKILKAASNKIQNMLADMEVRTNHNLPDIQIC